MTPLVSILIPSYNATPWIAQTLESALAQTWPHKEIIVVDDGSHDGSAEVTRTFTERGVKIFVQENRGASAARNHAFRLSRGDYVQFLDADDLLASDKIERQLARLLPAGPTAIATCAWARFHADPAVARFTPDQLWQDFAPVDWLVCSWRQHAMMATAAWLVPRVLAERAGPWNPALGHNPVDDMEYFSRVLLAADRVLFCGDTRAYYRSGLSGSLSRQQSDDAWRAIFASFHLTADRLLAREDSPRTRLAAATALQRLIFEIYPRLPAERATTARRVQALGGTDIEPDAGPWRRRLQSIVGWPITKRLHDWWYRP